LLGAANNKNILRSFRQDRQEREEEERKRRLQLYVFVSRCVAYPFNAKQPTDMTKRQLKVTKQQLESLQQRFQVSG
jgi:calcium-dependent secretion activator